MKYWHNPFKRWSSFWWRDLRRSITRFPFYLVERVQSVWDWLPVIWHDKHWDQGYLYSLLAHKIRRMRTDGNLNWSNDRRWRALVICDNLLQRIDSDVYADWYGDEYTRLTKAQRWRRFQHEEYMRQQDLDMLFSLMAKWSQTWWD